MNPQLPAPSTDSSPCWAGPGRASFSGALRIWGKWRPAGVARSSCWAACAELSYRANSHPRVFSPILVSHRSPGGRYGVCCMQEARQVWHGWRAGRSGMVAWGQQVTGLQDPADVGNGGSSAWLTACLCCRLTVRAVPKTLVPSCSPPQSEATYWPHSIARNGWAPSASWPSR